MDEHPDKWKLDPFHPGKYAVCVLGLMAFFNGGMALLAPCLLGCRYYETFLISIPVSLGFGWLYQLLWVEGEVRNHEEKRRRHP
jgi:hypothetical protein